MTSHIALPTACWLAEHLVLPSVAMLSRYLKVAARDVNVNTYSKGKYAQVLGQAGGWEWLQQLLLVSAAWVAGTCCRSTCRTA
jgi:hypothetical protein